jgi:hypothetical protein
MYAAKSIFSGHEMTECGRDLVHYDCGDYALVLK